MKYRYPDYYGQFLCIGGRCPQTCCTGWKIAIDDRTLRKYKKAAKCGCFPKAFRKKLSEDIDVRSGVFLSGSGRCPFLDREGLCEIYKKLGPESLCTTCRKYPRHMEDYGQLREVMLSLSCPEAARLILSRREKDTFRIRLTGKKVRKPVNGRKLKLLLNFRSCLIKTMQNRALPVEKRLRKIMRLSALMQKYFERMEKSSSRPVSAGIKSVSRGEMLCLQYIEMTEALEQVDKGWDKEAAEAASVLRAAVGYENFADSRKLFKEACQAFETAWEHLIIYSLFGNFLGAVYDDDIETKVKMAVYTYLVIREVLFARWLSYKKISIEDMIEISGRFSRLTEHSDTNIEALELMLSNNPLFSSEVMTKLIND